jgi:3-hydroxymyristoyl/3-hydroxydecanoyl-(acyl carrier protein) dehydratase
MPAAHSPAELTLHKLPHRVPFVLIDRVTAFDGRSARFLKAVTRNDALLGGWPAIPPTLILEAMAQAAGMLVAGVERSTALLLLVAADDVHFHAPVRSGAQLVLEVVLERARPPFYVVSARALVGDETRAEGRLTLARESAARPAEE